MERQREIVDACESGRFWEGFKEFSWSEVEYLHLVRVVFGITGLRLEALDGFWDTCFAKLKQELLLQLQRIDGPAMLPQPGLLVGVEEHLEAIKVLMGLRAMQQSAEGGGAQEVGIVGVKGMGGVGKTTLAKLVYNDKEVRLFFGGGVCWLEVNQEPSQETVCRLQKQILQTLGAVESSLTIANPTVGRAEIRKRLQSSGAKVLICLDDVWVDGHTPIVCKEDLSPGSCILKTTRDANTIEPGGFQHDLDVLSPEDAKHLFRATVLKGREPSAEVEALIGPTLVLCAGLPLALEVVGSAVAKILTREDGISQWGLLLAATKGASMGVTQSGARVLKILETSYDILPDQQHKDAFLFIASYQLHFGSERYDATLVSHIARIIFNEMERVKGCTIARLVLRELADRSLVNIESEFGLVTVHDLLKDVAVRVKNTEGTRFCTWVDKNVPLSEAGWKQEWEHMVVCDSVPFQLPTSLFDGNRVLSFVVEDCSFEFSNPGWFSFGRRQSRAANQCRQLQFRNCGKLQTLPSSIRTFTDLKSLRLDHCPELSSLPESFGQLCSLEELTIFLCDKFQHLPSSLGQLKALAILDLKCCSSLQSLPNSIGQLEGLRCLQVWDPGAIKTLPKSICQLAGL
jgi:hypothetical protein